MATAATPVTTQVWTREVDPEIHENQDTWQGYGY